jgi:hypothetical protein
VVEVLLSISVFDTAGYPSDQGRRSNLLGMPLVYYAKCTCGCDCEADGDGHFNVRRCDCEALSCSCVIDAPGEAVLDPDRGLGQILSRSPY